MDRLILRPWQRLAVEETAATATEYAIMLVLILLVAFATIIFLGEQVEQAFNTFAAMFAEASR